MKDEIPGSFWLYADLTATMEADNQTDAEATRTARWVAACECGSLSDDEGFVFAYERNRAELNALAVEHNAVATRSWPGSISDRSRGHGKAHGKVP
jgi:hypothetical protein